uniref:Uncharacterized protein n=1 Tax=Panagrolaimus sp. JU765 TaxID=591449 RepID=A0AC34R854_9BILA
MPWLYLPKCEAGWGYDCRTGLFIPIDDVGNLKTEFDEKEVYCFYKENPFHRNPLLDYDDFAHWVINENPNLPKFMEFYLANHQICEFAFKVWCWTKTIKAEKLYDYPQEATHFVERVYYGMG